MEEFLKKTAAYIAEKSLINDSKIVVAFSGGADSAALIDALHQLKSRGIIKAELFAAHINHNLRGEQSDTDRAFAEDFAARREIPFMCESVDVSGMACDESVSIETAARRLRRIHLARIAAKFGASTIATAHQKDDNAETMIHRLSRGTGLKGLGGIWPLRHMCVEDKSVVYVRPLLWASRLEIEQYCAQRNIQWRNDPTNAQLIYTRNVIRHAILPRLQAQSRGDLSQALFELSESSRKLFVKVNAMARRLWNECVSIAEDDTVAIDAAAFNGITEVLRQELIRMAYNRLGGSEAKITSAHYDAVIAFASVPGSAKLQLPCEIYCFRGYGRIIFRKITDVGVAFTIINSPGEFRFRGFAVKVSKAQFDPDDFERFLAARHTGEEWFDAAKVKLPIRLRSRETGDKFRPIGQRSHKRVGKFLIGARINHAQRAKMVVFEDEGKNIIWIAPHRSSDITKITKDTKEVLKISIKEI
jgi:tRNA(Ile)-lysidine synthase